MSFRKSFLLICLLIIGVIESVFAADATIGVDIASSFIFRGASINDRFVIQPSLEVSDFSRIKGLSVGVWANLDLADNSGGTLKSGEFSEVDLYAFYELPLGLDFYTASIGYLEYTYPHAEVVADRELAFISSFNTFLSPGFSVYPGLDGASARPSILSWNLDIRSR